MKSDEVGTTLKHPKTINGNVKNLSKRIKMKGKGISCGEARNGRNSKAEDGKQEYGKWWNGVVCDVHCMSSYQ